MDIITVKTIDEFKALFTFFEQVFKIDAISSDVPGALRNLINAKAPPIAIPIPKLPLTKVKITPTINGNNELTKKNLFVDFTLKDIIHAYNRPETNETHAIINSCSSVDKLLS